jgi:nitrite reductase/ring-hydroxylating ferredoxin subunit
VTEGLSETVDARVYTDPERFELERKYILNPSWQILCRSEELKDTGDHVVWEGQGETVLITRLKDGGLSAFHNICQHRGARIVRDSGCGARRFKCPWHDWVYDFDGTVIGIPDKEDFDPALVENARAPRVEVDEWGGWVFGVLAGPGIAPPLKEWLGEDIINDLGKYNMDKMYLREKMTWYVDVNWKVIIDAFKGAFGKRNDGVDPVAHIELPMKVSFIGLPICAIATAWMAHTWYQVPYWMTIVALPLVFALSLICTNAMALTSWTPTGALAKIPQFTFGMLDRSNPGVNLMTAGITASVAGNAANLLSDIKPGYMLGAKPRQQAVGHVIGIFAGSIAATPLFFLLLLPPDATGHRSTATLVSDQFAMPAALQWKGVADLIANGVSRLPPSAVISMVLAAVVALVFEILRVRTKGRFPLSAVSVGLGVVLPPESVLAMWFGALFFWLMARRKPAPGSRAHDLWVDGMEPICAGLISGAALVGIGNAIVNVLLV